MIDKERGISGIVQNTEHKGSVMQILTSDGEKVRFFIDRPEVVIPVEKGDRVNVFPSAFLGFIREIPLDDIVSFTGVGKIIRLD